MWKTTLAGLRAHRLRVFLAGLATVIGVAFIAGSIVLGDTLQANTQRTVTANAAEIDVAVLGSSGLRKLPQSAVEELSQVQGVERVQGVLEGHATLLGRDGRPVDQQPVAMSASIRTEIARGSAPTGESQVALAEATARSTGYSIGDQVGVLDHRGRQHEMRLTGLVDTRGRGALALRGAMLFSPDQTAAITGEERYQSVYVQAAADIAPSELRRRIARVVDTDTYEVITGEEWADRQQASSGLDPALISTALLMFALVALLVSGFVIYNTFSILVAQRMRELALLRCVGASRRQVFTSILLESLAIGVVASVFGLVLGIAAGYGAVPVLNAFGNELPYDVVTVTWITLTVSPLAGVGMTAVAAALPALAATRIAPVAALTSAPAQGSKSMGRRRVGTAVVLCGLGGAAAVWAVLLEPGQRYPLVVVAVSGMVFFVGVVALGPVIVRPLAQVAGFLPARMLGAPGRLAVANVWRNPKRATTTALALTVGVTLMTGVAVVTQTFSASVSAGVEKAIPVDYVISAPGSGEGVTLPVAVVEQLRDHEAVTGVAAQREKVVRIDGRQAAIANVAVGGPIDEPGLVAGTPLDGLGPHQLAVSPQRAREFGLEVGDTVVAQGEGGASVRLEVASLVRGEIFPPFYIPAEGFERHFQVSGYQAALVNVAPRLSAEESDRLIEQATSEAPTAEIVGAEDARQQLESTLSNLVMIVVGLLGLAVVISVIGIANTMTLSVVERTRESAMLRALGLSRRNLGWMLTIEALVLGIVGALIGVTLGAAFGAAAVSTIREDIVLSLPYGQIALIVVGAGVAGMVAAALPARRAARTSIVAALASE